MCSSGQIELSHHVILKLESQIKLLKTFYKKFNTWDKIELGSGIGVKICVDVEEDGEEL